MGRIAMLDSKLNAALWTEGEPAIAGSELRSGLNFDVAIIGGGFSGLWSAFHLLQLDSSLKVAIFQAREIGFGASGRNGGWASTDYPVSKATLIKRHGERSYQSLKAQLRDSVAEIGDFARVNAPGANFVKSGTLSFARNQAQLQRLEKIQSEGLRWLEGTELAQRIRVNGALAGVFNPDCATVQPYQLLKGLAGYLISQGVSIFTNTYATKALGGIFANSFFVQAPIQIQATEVYGEPGRDFIPLYSLMVATEPLPVSFWEEVGNVDRFTFSEYSHLVNYAQRTDDGRLAIGGRGATYPYGSKLTDSKEMTERVHEHIRSLAKSWFPALQDFTFTHSWGGAVAITRDWEPYVHWNKSEGFGRLGGYAGDGVTMSFLAAKALANLALEREDRTNELHFLEREIKRWEPEPIRYLAVNTLVKLSGVADREEEWTGKPSFLERLIAPLILR